MMKRLSVRMRPSRAASRSSMWRRAARSFPKGSKSGIVHGEMQSRYTSSPSPRYADRNSRAFATATVILVCCNPETYRSSRGPKSCIRGKNGRNSFHSFSPICCVRRDPPREERSAASQDPVDLVRVKFFVPIEDEVERSAVEWETQAVGAHHVDLQPGQPTLRERRVHGPRLQRDGPSMISRTEFCEELPTTCPQVEHGLGLGQEFPRASLVIPRQSRPDSCRRNSVEIPSGQCECAFDVWSQTIDVRRVAAVTLRGIQS